MCCLCACDNVSDHCELSYTIFEFVGVEGAIYLLSQFRGLNTSKTFSSLAHEFEAQTCYARQGETSFRLTAVMLCPGRMFPVGLGAIRNDHISALALGPE